MILLSPVHRAYRSYEWNAGKAVTFVVTLAATRSVTLAAREAGMSRKSAYALKSRDPAFARAWETALNTRSEGRKGGEVEEVQASLHSVDQGDSSIRLARSISSTPRRSDDRRGEEAARDLFFARLAANRLRAPGGGGLVALVGAAIPSTRRGRH